MISKIESSCIAGIDALPIEVEVDVAHGLPAFGMVGLPDTACRESQDRVRSAIKNSGFQFPKKKVVVNLAPANIKKEGAGYDLPIAIGILLASEQIKAENLSNLIFIGELSLDGKIRRVPGILPRVSAAQLMGKSIIFPMDNIREALPVQNADLRPVATLREASAKLNGCMPFDRTSILDIESVNPAFNEADFSDVKGQLFARRGLEVAAAGHHNLMMIGPPGSGKTMLARRIPSILTDLSFNEALETTKVHSVADRIKKTDSLVQTRPFRTPHHTISDVALVGGGSHPRPGEISLAHNGVLFLDELPEFRRNVLEVLRQPLEEGVIEISRSMATYRFPANFVLVAAMNPCPCGYYTDEEKECHCTPRQIGTYMGKISGPLLDRIDMHIEVARLMQKDFGPGAKGETSSEIKARVTAAIARQTRRYGDDTKRNAKLEGRQTEKYCPMTPDAGAFLHQAIEELGFSGRAYHKVLKIARTIADLDDKHIIDLIHLQESIRYRSLDRSLWLS